MLKFFDIHGERIGSKYEDLNGVFVEKNEHDISITKGDADMLFVANDRDPDDTITLIMCQGHGSTDYPLLIKLKYEEAKKPNHDDLLNGYGKWVEQARSEPKSSRAGHDGNNKVINSFILPDKKIMLILTKAIVYFDEDL